MNTGIEQAPSGTVIKAASFNIRYDNPEDGENAWPYRKDLVVQLLRDRNPDLGGLQEALSHQMAFLRKSLPEYHFYGVGREDGRDAGEYCPIFYNPGLFHREESGTFWLSPTPEAPGSIGWDASCPRILTWARLRDKRSGKVLFLANTHIDHVGQTAMKESARMILREVGLRAGGHPTILCGDFNSPPASPLYDMLTGRGHLERTNRDQSFRDSRKEAGTEQYGPDFTFHDFQAGTLQTDHPRVVPELIDYIFIKNRISSIRCEVISDSTGGRYPSDHMPVFADLKLEEP